MTENSVGNIPSKQASNSKEILSWIYLIVIALSIRFFLFEPFFVLTGSMKMTILEGDYLFSTKYSYGYSKQSFPFSPNIFSGRIFAKFPQRGDIVILRPPFNMDTRYVKRLIGLPGDKIQLINDVIHINDQPVIREEIGTIIDEKGKKYRKYKETLPNELSFYSYKLAIEETGYMLQADDEDNQQIFYVPSDHYFFLGDNRDESRDSRMDLGFVPFENFIAKGQFIYFSTGEMLWDGDYTIWQRLLRVGTWISSIRLNRIFTNLYRI